MNNYEFMSASKVFTKWIIMNLCRRQRYLANEYLWIYVGFKSIYQMNIIRAYPRVTGLYTHVLLYMMLFFNLPFICFLKIQDYIIKSLIHVHSTCFHISKHHLFESILFVCPFFIRWNCMYPMLKMTHIN